MTSRSGWAKQRPEKKTDIMGEVVRSINYGFPGSMEGRRFMKNNPSKKKRYSSKSFSGPVFYEIKVQGQLDLLWSKWFEGMALKHVENGESGVACTLISGPVIDQPALHGLFAKIRDLNLVLISVRRIIPGTNMVEEAPIKPKPSADPDVLGNEN
jgi:hypothetical protein